MQRYTSFTENKSRIRLHGREQPVLCLYDVMETRHNELKRPRLGVIGKKEKGKVRLLTRCVFDTEYCSTTVSYKSHYVSKRTNGHCTRDTSLTKIILQGFIHLLSVISTFICRNIKDWQRKTRVFK